MKLANCRSWPINSSAKGARGLNIVFPLRSQLTLEPCHWLFSKTKVPVREVANLFASGLGAKAQGTFVDPQVKFTYVVGTYIESISGHYDHHSWSAHNFIIHGESGRRPHPSSSAWIPEYRTPLPVSHVCLACEERYLYHKSNGVSISHRLIGLKLRDRLWRSFMVM